MLALNELWYKDYPRSSFHLFNDNPEWLQMDKAGHCMTSYYLGIVGKESLEWAGVNEKKARIWGGGVGFLFLTGIEVLDGFSTEWGFSIGDEVANLLGTGLYIGQEALWKEQRIKLKFSFSQTAYADFRPDLLGENTSQQILKDYNGQTYWASANISSFIRKKDSNFPQFINIAFGYGANGLLGGRSNPIEFQNQVAHLGFDRTRQYYVALDFDLTRINTNSRFLKTFLKAFGFIKIPAPTLELNEGGNAKFYWLYF